MMTDPAFAIKHEVEHLVSIQIETLGKPSLLTSSDLDQYQSRSKKIAALYRQIGPNVAKAISLCSSKSVLSRIEGGTSRRSPGGNPVERRLVIATPSRPVRRRILPRLCLFASARLSSAPLSSGPHTLPVLSLRFGPSGVRHGWEERQRFAEN